MTETDKTASAQARADLIKRNLEQLPPDEKALIGRAAQRFFTHVTFGVAFGSVLGAGIPYRRAIAKAVRAQASAKAAGAPPTSFYPTLARAAEGAARGGAEAGAQTGFKVPLIAQGIAGGLFGGYLGGWVGGASGTLASARLIEKEMPGGTERIKMTGLSIQRQLEELAKTGKAPKPPQPLGDDEQRFSRAEEAVDDSRRYEWTESADEQRPASQAARPTPTVEGAPTSSRWEELRKAQAAKPSAWDTIRESSARSSLPGDASSSPRHNEELRSSSKPQDEGSALSDKEARRREFDALVERERQGGNDSADGKRWK